jgi:hypothetical protein
VNVGVTRQAQPWGRRHVLAQGNHGLQGGAGRSLIGYTAIWLQNGNRGLQVNALGIILLIAAALTILRADEPAKPADQSGPAGGPDESLLTRRTPGSTKTVA